MAKYQKVEFLYPNVLLVINPKGSIMELYTPIKACVIEPIGTFEKNTIVYIEAIVKSKEQKILYFIIGKWYPYHHFKVGGK